MIPEFKVNERTSFALCYDHRLNPLNGKEIKMRPHLVLTSLFLSAIGNSTSAQEITHSFLACGQNTSIMGADGKPSWTYPAATRDGYVMDDGTIILTVSKSKRYRVGAVVSVDPDGRETLIWKGTQS